MNFHLYLVVDCTDDKQPTSRNPYETKPGTIFCLAKNFLPKTPNMDDNIQRQVCDVGHQKGHSAITIIWEAYKSSHFTIMIRKGNFLFGLFLSKKGCEEYKQIQQVRLNLLHFISLKKGKRSGFEIILKSQQRQYNIGNTNVLRKVMSLFEFLPKTKQNIASALSAFHGNKQPL